MLPIFPLSDTQRGLVSQRILPAAQVPGDGGQVLFQNFTDVNAAIFDT